MRRPRALGGRPLGSVLIPGFVLVASAAFSVSAVSLITRANLAAYEERLTGDTTQAAALFGKLTTSVAVGPAAVAGLAATVGPDNLTAAGFNAFTAPLLDSQVLVTLEWVPRVLAADLAAFEEQVRSRGFLDFAVYSLNADGTQAAPATTGDLYPVTLAEPRAENIALLGFDVGSDAVRRQVIEQARDTASFVATTSVRLNAGGTGTLVVVPAYSGGAAPSSSEDRRAAFLGAAIGVYRPQELMDRATLQLSGDDISIALFDLGFDASATPDNPTLIAYRPSANGTSQAPPTYPEAGDPRARSVPVSFAGRQLMLVGIAGVRYAEVGAVPTWPIIVTALACVLAAAVYVRQRRQFEYRLRSSAARLRSVVSASPDAFIGLDSQGRIVDWSTQAAKMFGIAADQVMGRSIASLLEVTSEPTTSTAAPVSFDMAMQTLAEPSRPGDSVTLELIALRLDGTLLPVEVTIAPSAVESRWSIACFVRDATERLQAREDILRARQSEAMGQLTGRLAHDFNNLLGIVVGTLDLARDELEDRPGTRELVDMALDAGMRGADVTRALLAMARGEGLAPADVDLNRLITEFAPLLRQTAGSGIALQLDLCAEPTLAHVDASGFTNALLNLAINSIHAMAGSGTLGVRTRCSETGDFVVEITDSGPGMPPDVAARAFEPFFTTKHHRTGTGLGLPIVHAFATQSGGSVNLESAPGEGTTVRLVLPSARTGEAAALVPDADGHAGGTERVLLVDDEPELRKIVSVWLTNAGYQVTVAGSGPEALVLLEADPPDLIVSDVIMPGPWGGLELALKARALHPGIAIVMVSGYVGADLKGVIESGLPLVEKPYRRQVLLTAVRTALDAAEASRQPA